MVLVIPFVIVVVLFTLMRGDSFLLVLLPTVVMVGLGVVFVSIALQDGRSMRHRSVRRLPTDHLRRQLFLALRPTRPGSRRNRDRKPE
jgi:hypothetical protein